MPATVLYTATKYGENCAFYVYSSESYFGAKIKKNKCHGSMRLVPRSCAGPRASVNAVWAVLPFRRSVCAGAGGRARSRPTSTLARSVLSSTSHKCETPVASLCL